MQITLPTSRHRCSREGSQQKVFNNYSGRVEVEWRVWPSACVPTDCIILERSLLLFHPQSWIVRVSFSGEKKEFLGNIGERISKKNDAWAGQQESGYLVEPSFRFKSINKAWMHYCFTVKAKIRSKSFLPMGVQPLRTFSNAMQQNKHHPSDEAGGSYWFCLGFFFISLIKIT